MTRAPLPILVAASRRRTRWAVVAVLAGILLTLTGEAFDRLLPHDSLALSVVLTSLSVAGLGTTLVAVLLLVRWVNERSADLHLALSTSEAVLWRLYPGEDRLEFVAGDPAAVGTRAELLAGLAAADPAGGPVSYAYRAVLPSRGLRRIAVRALPSVDPRGRPVILGVSWDETERRASADRAERAGRLYGMLGALNRATRAAESLDRLYRQVAEAVGAAGECPLVWIGQVDGDAVRVLAAAAADGPATVTPEPLAGKGVVARALRERTPVWSAEPGEAAVPFRTPEGGTAVLVLRAGEPGFFTHAERPLLDRFADDLAVASERLVAREQQRHQRELLTALIASAPVPIISVDPDGRVSEIWNAAAEATFGWRREEVLGQPMPFVPGEAREGSQGMVRAVMEGAVLRGIPVRRRRRDGTELDMLLAAAPLHDARGRATGVLGVMMDQTERLAAEARMRESEARFRRMSENAADVIYRYRLHPAPHIEYVNPAVQVVLGYTPEELYARDDAILHILHPDERPGFAAIMAHPETVEHQRVALRWRHRDGRTVWVEHRGVLVRDDAGQVVALEGIARDITERRRAEEELARHSRVVEQTSEAVIITEPSGAIAYVNPAFERMTGWTRREVLGQNPRLLKSGNQPREFYADLWARITRGETWSGRVTNQRKDGATYVADAIISPVRDAGGRIVNYVGMQRDITRQRELEDQLRQSQKMEALGQLTGGIAHDFNNLLTIILSNATLLADAVTDQPALARDVQAIRTAAGRGARVVRQLMQFGRHERLEPVATDLGAQVQELATTFRRVLPENIAVDVRLTAAVPAARADPTAVEQMLLNLATNARDAMPDGGRLELAVDLRPDEEGDEHRDWVVVTVRDNGVGMSREVVARIFEPFYTTKPAGKGTGLGLAMVYGLTQQQGGRVTVDSEPGLGTTVRLHFPVAGPADLVPAAAASPADLPRGAGELVLLVEDEEGLRDVGARILTSLGYRVETAEDGAAALAWLDRRDGPPDVLVTDVVMPGMTGPELLEAVRRRGITVPVLFATGYATSEVLQDLGERDVLLVEKPWTLEEFARKVRAALARG